MKCPLCQKDKDIEGFRRLTGLRDKFNKLCNECIAPRKARYTRKMRPKTDTDTHLHKGVKERATPKGSHKVCRKCDTEKLFTEFAINTNIKCGLNSWCISCLKEYQQQRRFKTRKRPIPKQGHKICTGCRIEKPATLEFFHKLKHGAFGLSARCKACDNEKSKEWYKANPEKAKISVRKTQIKRREKTNAYFRNRYKLDPFFRARTNLRNRIREIMVNGTYSHTVGCSGNELKIHLESLFQPGMSWENYGEWHIDHKYPLSIAYAEGLESFKKACHYTNLQPLWAKDNQRKSNKIIRDDQ